MRNHSLTLTLALTLTRESWKRRRVSNTSSSTIISTRIGVSSISRVIVPRRWKKGAPTILHSPSGSSSGSSWLLDTCSSPRKLSHSCPPLLSRCQSPWTGAGLALCEGIERKPSHLGPCLPPRLLPDPLALLFALCCLSESQHVAKAGPTALWNSRP